MVSPPATPISSSSVVFSSRTYVPARLTSPDIEHDKEPEQQPEPKIIKNETIVNLYISTHKDFDNKLIVNPNYKILCDDRSQLKNNYSIEIISTNTSKNILFPKRIGYGEGSKIPFGFYNITVSNV